MPLALFVLGFAAALVVVRDAPEPTAANGVGAVGALETIDAAAVREFLAAVSAGDFPAMRELGGRVFVKGRRVGDRAAFAEYGTNSVPPYTVYALHADNAPDAVRRVLLTLDAEGRVESFLAEEMKLAE